LNRWKKASAKKGLRGGLRNGKTVPGCGKLPCPERTLDKNGATAGVSARRTVRQGKPGGVRKTASVDERWSFDKEAGRRLETVRRHGVGSWRAQRGEERKFSGAKEKCSKTGGYDLKRV